MALPSGVSYVTNIQGRPGTFDEATAETVPYTDPLEVEISGERGEVVHFKIPATAPSAETVSSDTATAGWVASDGSLTGPAVQERIDATVAPVYGELARTTAPVRRVQDGLDGVVGGRDIDNTAAIQQIINEAGRGGTIVFTQAGPTAALRIDSTLYTTHNTQRFMGESGDAYWTHLWTNQPITMLESRHSGTYLERLAFRGDRTVAAADATAVKLYGDSSANVDATVRNCTFMGLAVGVEHHGKNLKLDANLFSNSKTGIRIGGRDLTHHTVEWDSRGVKVRGNSFHTMGASQADAAIDIPAGSAHRQSVVDNNVFNGGGFGTDVRVVGDSANIHRQIDFTDNKHYSNTGAGYHFDFFHQFAVSGSRLTGVGSGAGNGMGFRVSNTVDATFNDISVRAYHRAFRFENSTHLFLRSLLATSNALHGFDFAGGIDRVLLDSIVAYSNAGWGMTGPSALANLQRGVVYAYSNTSGQINSTLAIPV